MALYTCCRNGYWLVRFRQKKSSWSCLVVALCPESSCSSAVGVFVEAWRNCALTRTTSQQWQPFSQVAGFAYTIISHRNCASPLLQSIHFKACWTDRKRLSVLCSAVYCQVSLMMALFCNRVAETDRRIGLSGCFFGCASQGGVWLRTWLSFALLMRAFGWN